MMKSHDDLVAALKAAGMAVNAFTITSQGFFTKEDVDWNYKDVPHLDHVHPNIHPVLGIVEDDKNIFINLQRVFGVRLPLSVVSYHPATEPETSFTTWLFYVLIVSVRSVQVDAETCRTETRYSVVGPRLLAWTLPLLRWLIKRNYRGLMKDDIPMRSRRVELRRRGYRFRRQGDRYSFLDSLDVARSNVIPPAGAAPFDAIGVELDRELPSGGELLLGDDGHLGLRLLRQGDHILAFPRLCQHQGASLDHQICTDKRLKCPWHGRVIAPLAELNLAQPGREERRAGAYLLKLDGFVLRVEPYADRAPVAPA